MANKNFLEQIGKIFLLYKLRWVILIGIILMGVIIISLSKSMDKEYQEYGYSGFFDNIKYDEWTDEVIPKDKINSPTIKYKSITTPDGSNVSEKEFEYYVEEYRKVQDSYGYLTEERKSQVESLINMLFGLMFKIDYSFEKTSTNTLYIIHLKNFDANGVHYDDYEIGPTFEFKHILKLLFKGIYREQNGLEPDFGN